MELINLTAERQHRCAGIKAGRQGTDTDAVGKGGMGLLLFLASCLSTEKGSEVKWKTYLIFSG